MQLTKPFAWSVILLEVYWYSFASSWKFLLNGLWLYGYKNDFNDKHTVSTDFFALSKTQICLTSPCENLWRQRL